MTDTQTDAPPTRRSRRAVAEPVAVAPPAPAKRRRGRFSVFGLIGELFLTAGVVVLLYVGWQMYIGDLIYGAQNNARGQELSEQWQQEFESQAEPTPPAAEPDAPAAPVEPAVIPAPADAQVFGNMHIPRFGADYAVPMAGGVSRARTLDTIGIGHYPDAAMPGEVGNFALAAHRTTFGAPFNRIAELHVGDAIVVEVEAGWYTYRFRSLEYVTPSSTDVLFDVPRKPEVPAGDRYITMTSCSPIGSLAERIVGYGVFESFTPRSQGAPASLTEVVA